jgi:hypothetical protein
MKSKPLLCLALVLSGVLFGCSTATNAPKKAEPFQPLESVADYDETNFPTAVSALTNILAPQFVPTVINLANHAQTNFFLVLTNSEVLEVYAALKFVVELKDKNQLPGVSKDDQMSITTGLPMSHLKEVKYPFSGTFDLVLAGESFTNHYAVVRPAADAAWQLEKAWRTDAQGHAIKEWPVK